VKYAHEARIAALRQQDERQQLIDAQIKERAVLQDEFKALRSAQAKQLSELRQDVGRFLAMQRGAPGPSRSIERSNETANGLGLRR
jgi:hypothetical protein